MSTILKPKHKSQKIIYSYFPNPEKHKTIMDQTCEAFSFLPPPRCYPKDTSDTPKIHPENKPEIGY